MEKTARRSPAKFGSSSAPEHAVHAVQETLSALLVPIMQELAEALQGEINRKVKQAKKRHKKKGITRDIDPFFFIAERLLLRNTKHSETEERKQSITTTIHKWRKRSSVNFAANNLSEWCVRHIQNVVKKRDAAERRKREKQRKREARDSQKKRGSTFFQGGKTPRSPRSPRSLGPKK